MSPKYLNAKFPDAGRGLKNIRYVQKVNTVVTILLGKWTTERIGTVQDERMQDASMEQMFLFGEESWALLAILSTQRLGESQE